MTITIPATWKVTEFVPNERLAYERKFLGIHTRKFLEVQASDGGTRITRGEETLRISRWWLPIVPIWLIGYLLILPFAPIRWWTQWRTMRRLKKRVEAIP